MKTETLKKLRMDLEGLTAEQRQQVAERVKPLGERADSARLIGERLGTPSVCAHCGSGAVARFGYSAGQQRFCCKACGKTFMTLTGTPMQRLREQDQWVAYVECLSQGMSIRASAKAVGLTVDRSFRWRHRLLAFLADPRPAGLTWLVAADETIFRRSFKGQRKGLPRAAKQRGGPTPEGTEGERVPVRVAMPRGRRRATDPILNDGMATTMTAALR